MHMHGFPGSPGELGNYCTLPVLNDHTLLNHWSPYTYNETYGKCQKSCSVEAFQKASMILKANNTVCLRWRMGYGQSNCYEVYPLYLTKHASHPLLKGKVANRLPLPSWKLWLASFPGLLRLQFLIACSMQKRREKAWGISSHDPWHG